MPELKLNLLSPNGFNHNSINGALDELESNAYYLYYAQSSSSGKRFWFHTKPNINILINQAKSDIQNSDISSEILARIQQKSRNVVGFTVLVNPSEDIPEQMKPTLLILHPGFMGSTSGLNPNTQAIVEKIATKKGSSERIYRNTLLFLVCSEIGIGKLQSEAREFLACQKISLEYQNQLETEQRQDLKKRQEDASKGIETALVAAYSLVVKYSVRQGAAILQIRQFRESLDAQINMNVLEALKTEEWLLDSVGMGTLKNNNLFPEGDTVIKAKDAYEAFLRFDDKPMITGKEAVSKSLQRYCTNGEFCIATGDGVNFTRYFFQESIPYFDVEDLSYWLIDKTRKPAPATPNPGGVAEPPTTNYGGVSQGTSSPGGQGGPASVGAGPTAGPTGAGTAATSRQFRSITISGKVPLEQYTQVFSSFLMPLAQNNIEIEIRITGKSTSARPITEDAQEYKIIKESARQMGLRLDEDV